MKLLLFNPCKTSHQFGLALDSALVKVVLTTSLVQAHIFWDARKEENFLIAEGADYRPEQRFPKLISCPCLFVLLQGWANIYSLSVYLVVLLSQMSPDLQCTVCYVEAGF